MPSRKQYRFQEVAALRNRDYQANEVSSSNGTSTPKNGMEDKVMDSRHTWCIITYQLKKTEKESKDCQSISLKLQASTFSLPSTFSLYFTS